VSVSGHAVVTGASGFVGSHLVDALVGAGVRTRCVLRPSSSSRWLPPAAERAIVSSGDQRALERAVEGAHTIYHLAAATSAVNADGYQRANVELTRALVDVIRASAPNARVILCSTLAAAGPSLNGHPRAGHDPPEPIGPYGASKLASERMLASSGLEHVIVRPPAVYGPRDRDILTVFRLALRGVVPSFAPRSQQLSLIHVEDLAESLRLAALNGRGGSLYCVADGPPHSWGDIVDAIGEVLERRVRFVRLPLVVGRVAAHSSCAVARFTGSKPMLTPERVANMAGGAWTCDDARARAELGFTPRIGLRDGLAETVRWYRQEGWL
jgi:nucleoside-diphosphate-sugar epimerase